MAEKRNITKEDILLEARIRAEGARIEVKKEAGTGRNPVSQALRPIVIDGCEMVTSPWQNPTSRLGVIVDGNDVTISDMNEVLGTATLEARPPWKSKLLSDGSTLDSYFGNADIATIFLAFGCSLSDSSTACKYCGSSAVPPGRKPAMSPSDFQAWNGRVVEATAIAIQNGWRGTILFTGGMRPPSRRGQATGDMERSLDQLRESIDDEIFSQLHIAMGSSFPLDDLGELDKWKDIGINATELDSQVVDPAYFKAICPGRGDQDRWLETQTASAEVFGRGRGATSGIVMGVEPMAGLLEGVEERVSRGIFTQLFTFVPVPGTPMGGMMPPSAAWFVEAAEKIADIYLRYADTFDVDLTEDTRWGYTRKGRSFYISLVDDEMARRLQEMGKLGPGLPKQNGLEPA